MAVESAVWQNGVKGPMGVEGYHMWFIAFSLLIKPSGCCLNNGVITEETTPKINVSEQLCNNCFMVYGIFSCDEVTVRIYFIFFLISTLAQASDSLGILCVSALVLDEDGTGVDTEEFFQTLPENAVLMALQKEQKWSPHPVCSFD